MKPLIADVFNEKDIPIIEGEGYNFHNWYNTRESAMAMAEALISETMAVVVVKMNYDDETESNTYKVYTKMR